MTTAGDALNVMRALIGTVEQPRGSNYAPPVTTWYPMQGAWCAMTVSYALAHAGHDPAVKFAWTPTGVARFKSGAWGTWHESDPQPGDLVFYSFGGSRPDHVGMVESVSPSGDLVTIEGNVGDSCKRLARSMATRGLLGFGRPAYSSSSAPATGAPTATGGRRTLALGARGDDVRTLQTILVGAGLLEPAGVDGAFGPRTRAAVIQLQTQLRVHEDGIVGPETHDALDRLMAYLAGLTAAAPATGPLLRQGAAGPDVTRLQLRLEAHGYGGRGVTPPDGVMGRRTVAAVRRFQSDRGLTADGIVGPNTWAALG